jgi:hypothetical protein
VRYAGQVSLLEREALTAARGGLSGSRVRVSVVVNADSLHTWFLPALTALPDLAFDLHQDDQEYTADLLRAGAVMAAVTSQNVAVQGCRVEPLGKMRYLAVAAPSLGFTDFATAPVILLNRKDQLQHRFLASLTRRHLDPPVHYVPAAAAFVEAIRLGVGAGAGADRPRRHRRRPGARADAGPAPGRPAVLAVLAHGVHGPRRPDERGESRRRRETSLSPESLADAVGQVGDVGRAGGVDAQEGGAEPGRQPWPETALPRPGQTVHQNHIPRHAHTLGV